MDILNPKTLSSQAQTALRRSREPKKVIYGYALVTLVINLVVIASDYLLEHQISGTGGLGNMGSRAVLSTIQQAVPSIATYLAMCLELGFLGAMMRLVRGQYADQTDLKVGLRLFWPLIRMTLLMSLLYFLVLFLAFQICSTLFMLTPWSAELVEILMPIVESGNLELDEATMAAASSAMTPMILMLVVVGLLVIIPLAFRMRMANYCLLDNPRAGARAALRRSNRMMRGKFLPMLKLDLSQWVYHISMVLVNVILYLDFMLSSLGIEVPVSAELFGLILYALSMLWQFFIQVKLRPGAEATYLMAYEQLREKPKDDGVVLGNIFDM